MQFQLVLVMLGMQRRPTDMFCHAASPRLSHELKLPPTQTNNHVGHIPRNFSAVISGPCGRATARVRSALVL